MHLIFVYGSLQRGFYNHHFLKDATFVCETRTQARAYDLVAMPSLDVPGEVYPAVIKDGAYHISGEVYEVDEVTLAALDDLEEQDIHFRREQIACDSGHKAWMYVLINKDGRDFEPAHGHIHRDGAKYLVSWMNAAAGED